MKKIQVAKRHHFGVHTFRWGIYFQLRWKGVWWHLKFSTWYTGDLTLSTRKQNKIGEVKRYVHGIRFQVTAWRTRFGRREPGYAFGFIVYGSKKKAKTTRRGKPGWRGRP